MQKKKPAPGKAAASIPALVAGQRGWEEFVPLIRAGKQPYILTNSKQRLKMMVIL